MMKENNFIEMGYSIFLTIGILPSMMYGIDIFYSYHYWYIVLHLALLYCLFKKNRDTWWILFFLTFGMLLIDRFVDSPITYACRTTFNLVQWLVNYCPDFVNDKFIEWIQTLGIWMQRFLFAWAILKSTRLKYGI